MMDTARFEYYRQHHRSTALYLLEKSAQLSNGGSETYTLMRVKKNSENLAGVTLSKISYNGISFSKSSMVRVSEPNIPNLGYV